VLSPFTSKQMIRENVLAYRSALEASVTETAGPTISATINGKPTELLAGTTVAEFLTGRELHERLVVVERNGEIIKRAIFPEVIIEEGDLLEIVHFVGGG
ncbi:MAG: sulfur carrier protein ThiS, partial [Thermomicrobiales bacterium]